MSDIVLKDDINTALLSLINIINCYSVLDDSFKLVSEKLELVKTLVPIARTFPEELFNAVYIDSVAALMVNLIGMEINSVARSQKDAITTSQIVIKPFTIVTEIKVNPTPKDTYILRVNCGTEIRNCITINLIKIDENERLPSIITVFIEVNRNSDISEVINQIQFTLIGFEKKLANEHFSALISTYLDMVDKSSESITDKWNNRTPL